MLDFIATSIKGEIFGGVVAGSLVVSLLYMLRQVPAYLLKAAQWKLTCNLVILNEDQAFGLVSEWLSSLEYSKRCRSLRLTTLYDNKLRQEVEILSPGLGYHMFWYRGRPMLIRRWIPDKASISHARHEDIRITTIGSSPVILQELVEEIKEHRNRLRDNLVDIFLYKHTWRIACRKPKRLIESVVLPHSQKQCLYQDIERFIESKQWYVDKGVPYRRGYLLTGPPGCGKSTLVLALASHFARPIYSLNLGSIYGDIDLIEAVSEVPEHGILLLEDIDAVRSGEKRQRENKVSTNEPKKEPEGISLSALLNVLDGVYAKEGRILIMTTNFPDKVDTALLRPGRVDCRECLSELNDIALVEEMCCRFLGSQGTDFAKTVKRPISAASLQELLVREAHTDIDSGVRHVRSLAG